MAGFDTRNALNLAIRHLSNAALERAAGGYIPPKEAERQRKEQERLHTAQQRDMERQQKDQARQEEKARKEAERAAKDNGGSIGWSKKRSNAEIRSSHYEDGRSKSHVGYVNPIDFLHATTSNDDELRTIMKSAGDLNREKIEEECHVKSYTFVIAVTKLKNDQYRKDFENSSEFNKVLSDKGKFNIKIKFLTLKEIIESIWAEEHNTAVESSEIARLIQLLKAANMKIY